MCPPTSRLVGPPAIRRLPPASAAALPVQPASAPGDPLVDLMDADFNPPPKGRTENNSPTFLSTGNPCLDFFFHVVPDTPPETVVVLLSAAWAHDALTALKLACQLRGVRGTGKSDKEGFYSFALWLHRHHPKTLALNVASFAEFGYMKDLLEILYRLINHPDIRKITKEQRLQAKIVGKRRWHCRSVPQKMELFDHIAAKLAKIEIPTEKQAGVSRRRRTAELAGRAVQRYTGDPEYQFLHDRIAEFFAGLLASDMEQLRGGNLEKVSLAAKWCPSLDSSFDRATLLCESIARQMFPRESDPEYAGIEEEHYAYRVRNRLRREVLVPLRKVLELPEVYMSSCQWDGLPYSRVASVAMKRYKKVFIKHDQVRFADYLEKVKEGKAKIAAGALLPHEILAPAYQGEHDEVAELQWRRMVEDMSTKGKLKNCIAVCDVSGSMSGIPMDVCVALGLLISELSEQPWKGRVITFSAEPKIHKITGDTIREKTMFVRTMEWGMNTNFQAVFDRILTVAVEGKLPPEKMIRRVFVFSDMEFDQASANNWETDYEAICRKFRESGYGSAVPEIVFWNLRDSTATPVPSNQKGVALVSGFSKNLVKVFLEGDGDINPESIMMQAISGEEYQKLVVFD